MTIKKSKASLRLPAKKPSSFDSQAFLDTAGVSKKVSEYRRGESIFTQGDLAVTVMYIQRGGVRLSVVNGSGKDAVVAMFGPTDFLARAAWRAKRSAWLQRPLSLPLFF